MNLNKSKLYPGILTPHNLGRSAVRSASKQSKEANRRLQQRNNFPKGQFIRENDIQVDLSRNKIKLEIKEEPTETEMNRMDDVTNHQGIQMSTNNGPHNLRRENSDSDISVGSNELIIVEENEVGANVEESDEDEKVEISDEDLERMFAQKDKEIEFLRKQVKDLKKTVKEQGEKVTNLNKLVQKHDTFLNRIVEVGGGELKYELKAISDGRHSSQTVTSGGGQGQREQETSTQCQDQSGTQSESDTSGITKDVGGTSSKDNIQGQDRRNKSVTFGETFYEGEPSQPPQFYQPKWQRDWHPDGHRGRRRRDWYLHDNRMSPQAYKRQPKDPYYLSPTSNRRFRARSQGYRGRGSQFNCRHSDDPNVRSNLNYNYQYQNYKRFDAANEAGHQLNQNSGYNGGGVNEEVETQSQSGNEMEEDEVFQCPHCPWKFGERLNMERHCEAQHKLFKCDMCDKQYGFEESLRRHLQSEH